MITTTGNIAGGNILSNNYYYANGQAIVFGVNFTALKENLNYKWETLRRLFPKYFPTDEMAKDYASRPNKQAAIANRIYAGRMGNGDEQSSDPAKWIGRGLIQLTGRSNYQAFADSDGLDGHSQGRTWSRYSC